MKSKTKKPNARSKITYVRWKDHHSVPSGWIDKEDIADQWPDFFCETVGFVVYEDKDKLGLCHNQSKETYSDAMVIYKNLIVERKEL